MSVPYLPLYCGDYLGDTRHLTTEQHGAYLLLLMCMWRAGGALPNDPRRLASMCGLTAARWAKVSPAVLEFFDDGGDRLTHARLVRELEKHARASQRNSANGKRGARAKILKNNDITPANAEVSLKQPDPEPEPDPEPLTDDDARAGAEDWPKDPIEDLRSRAGLERAEWQGHTAGVIIGWKNNGFSYADDVVPAVKSVAARMRHPPRSWEYFTSAIAERRAQRTRVIAPAQRTAPPHRSGDDAWDIAIRQLVESRRERRKNSEQPEDAVPALPALYEPDAG